MQSYFELGEMFGSDSIQDNSKAFMSKRRGRSLHQWNRLIMNLLQIDRTSWAEVSEIEFGRKSWNWTEEISCDERGK